MKIRGRSKCIQVVFCAFVCSEICTLSSECFKINPRELSWDDINQTEVRTTSSNAVEINSTRTSRDGQEITLIGFLQSSVQKYGEKKVASAIYELAQKSMYDLMWMLAGDLEPWLLLDLYKTYNVANSDPAVLSVYERFKAGDVNRTIVPEVFALDKKYDEFSWWKRVRTRMLQNVDKYIAGTLQVTGTPPPTFQFKPDGNPIIETPAQPTATPARPAAVKPTTTTEDPDDEDTEDPEDEDSEDINSGSGLSDLFSNLLS